MKKDKNCVLTPEGFLKLESELNELKQVKRPEVIEALKEARALGDLAENADYDSARNDQAQIESKIKELERMLDNCIIVDKKKTNSKVGLGSVVTIEFEDGAVEEYKLVGSLETDLFNNKISVESPIGSAVLDKKKNDTVEVSTPNGSFKVTIVKIA